MFPSVAPAAAKCHVADNIAKFLAMFDVGSVVGNFKGPFSHGESVNTLLS